MRFLKWKVSALFDVLLRNKCICVYIWYIDMYAILDMVYIKIRSQYYNIVKKVSNCVGK